VTWNLPPSKARWFAAPRAGSPTVYGIDNVRDDAINQSIDEVAFTRAS
jgi:hypothetical protein